MRILNKDTLLSHSNKALRSDALDIIESGMTACDPYENTRKLLQLESGKLTVGGKQFEADGDPDTGATDYDVTSFQHIYVVGAGKGVQLVVKAIEDVLGDYLTGGEIICKHGDPMLVKKVHVTMGSHPTPGHGCVEGCQRILNLSSRITENDLVFTVIMNGGSSLLTCPADGITLEDTIEVTRLMQIELGVTTRKLNALRNHIDKLKGGKLLRLFSRATLINLCGADLNRAFDIGKTDFQYLVKENYWLHNVPDGTTYEGALQTIKEFNVEERIPASVMRLLRSQSPENASLKYEEYRNFKSRIFGVMPEADGFFHAAMHRAKELGYTPYFMSDGFNIEASHVGAFIGLMAECISRRGQAMKLPAALIFTGEMIVTVGESENVGGRNQEAALSCAKWIADKPGIVYAGVDTDGTDGPGGFIAEDAPRCLAGAIVDGNTKRELKEKGFELEKCVLTHNTSAPLWKTNNGIFARQGVSLNDLVVVLLQ